MIIFFKSVTSIFRGFLEEKNCFGQSTEQKSQAEKKFRVV